MITVEDKDSGEVFELAYLDCVQCGKDVQDAVFPKEYVKYFGSGFCSEECWDAYVESK